MMDWVAYGPMLTAIGFLVAQVIALIVGWVRMKDQANDAKEEAAEAKKIALEAHATLAVTNAEFARYREQVARDYVTRDTIREVEHRVVHAARETETRLSQQIQHVIERIDRAFGRQTQS